MRALLYICLILFYANASGQNSTNSKLLSTVDLDTNSFYASNGYYFNTDVYLCYRKSQSSSKENVIATIKTQLQHKVKFKEFILNQIVSTDSPHYVVGVFINIESKSSSIVCFDDTAISGLGVTVLESGKYTLKYEISQGRLNNYLSILKNDSILLGQINYNHGLVSGTSKILVNNQLFKLNYSKGAFMGKRMCVGKLVNFELIDGSFPKNKFRQYIHDGKLKKGLTKIKMRMSSIDDFIPARSLIENIPIPNICIGEYGYMNK